MSAIQPVPACGVLLKHLPVALWPSMDTVCFAAAFMRVSDPFDPQGPGAHLAETTIAALQHTYRRWLGYLTLVEPAAVSLPPTERVTPDRVRGFVAELRVSNSEYSVAIHIDKLYSAIKYMAPDQDWGWLRKMRSALLQTSQPRSKPVIPINSACLQDIGLAMMEDADAAAELRIAKGRRVSSRIAILHRDGLLIALLSLLPLRRKNVTMLELGTSLVRTGEVWQVVLPGSDTKNGDDIEASLLPQLCLAIDRHLSIHRPVFRNHDRVAALWLSWNGRPLSAAQLCSAFQKRIKLASGIHLSLHDVRDIAATTIAIARPVDVSVASDLLGHRDMRTTQRHYITARGVEASRAMSDTITTLRARSTALKKA